MWYQYTYTYFLPIGSILYIKCKRRFLMENTLGFAKNPLKSNIYFDCEFTGLHKNTTLMSIGLVSELGATFYAELNDYDKDQIDEWLEENVISHFKYNAPIKGKDDLILEEDHPSRPDAVPLHYSTSMRCNMARLKIELTKWLDQFKLPGYQIQMVSDCMAYDWVLFNDIFGHAFNIPNHVCYIHYDICTKFVDQDIDPDISREEFISEVLDNIEGDKHNALYDAKVIQACYLKLNGYLKV